ncbi:MAG: DUF1254 domain-containing protein [Actinomycetia bacterium]|nr:DUF1254 domain-containing protein [Actinomycetes bacterium]MCH9766346.1 DUF1254 domain-containing protein [Actinomycetes bacterium]
MTLIPESLTTPDTLDSPLGKLSFVDGAPTDDTAQKVFDHLDMSHAFNAYVNGYQLVSLQAIHKGIREAGVEDNGGVLLFSGLMDSQSLFLTANADTVYYIFAIDVSDGPIVVETPPDALGLFDDFWFQHVIDFGRPGPDRSMGGKFLLVPPGYDGPMPDSGYHVGRPTTNNVLAFGRSFMVDSDPAPTVATIKSHLKIYPYTPGRYGTSIATLLEGGPLPAKPAEIKPVNFVEGTGLEINTVPPSDYTYYEMLNEVVQEQPSGTLSPEIVGSFAAIGIVKGRPFAPDDRMKKLLANAAVVANATGRALNWRFREEDGFGFYPDSAWYNMLFVGGSGFETQPPAVKDGKIVPYPPTGYRTLNARFAFFYAATGVTPSMCMLLADIGSQYLLAAVDSQKKYFDGSKSYRCTLPPNIPENNFWSFTVYDNQTRSMLQTPQRFPRAGSQSFPSPAAVPNADGSVDIYFGPTPPTGKESNWIQTMPGKGWFTILRLYNPLEAFFDKSWKVGEIEEIS